LLGRAAFFYLVYRVEYTERRRTKRKKDNVFNQNSLGSVSRRTSTERRKTKKKNFKKALLAADPKKFLIVTFRFLFSFSLFSLCGSSR
jgi:hypothetical protein